MKEINSHLEFHLVFCTKYRRKVLTGEVEKDLMKILSDVHPKVIVRSFRIMPDHVDLLFKLTDSKMSVHSAVSKIKGKSSHQLRKLHPFLKSRIPSLWTRSYYLVSIGTFSEVGVEEYINGQKIKQ